LTDEINMHIAAESVTYTTLYGLLHSVHCMLYTSDGKIDSNRFTLRNRNEKFRFSTTATTP